MTWIEITNWVAFYLFWCAAEYPACIVVAFAASFLKILKLASLKKTPKTKEKGKLSVSWNLWFQQLVPLRRMNWHKSSYFRIITLYSCSELIEYLKKICISAFALGCLYFSQQLQGATLIVPHLILYWSFALKPQIKLFSLTIPLLSLTSMLWSWVSQGNHSLCITSCMKHTLAFPRKQLKITFITPVNSSCRNTVGQLLHSHSCSSWRRTMKGQRQWLPIFLPRGLSCSSDLINHNGRAQSLAAQSRRRHQLLTLSSSMKEVSFNGPRLSCIPKEARRDLRVLWVGRDPKTSVSATLERMACTHNLGVISTKYQLFIGSSQLSWGGELGPPCPRMPTRRGSKDSGAALGLHKHLEISCGLTGRWNSLGCEPLGVEGRAPFLPTGFSAESTASWTGLIWKEPERSSGSHPARDTFH